MHADKWRQETSEILQKLTPEIVAIGEIGLDYSAGMPSRELQQKVFRAQLRIARDAALPVIIHCRKAFADTLKILNEYNTEKFGGVMHAFSGSLETARECISMGLKIGIAGTVTWSNAVRPLAILKEIPLQHLLLETDSPDLSPEPHRGETNEPAFLINIATKTAELKGVSIEELAAVTTENARAVFRGIRDKI
jgi:TatD DNase family protein